MKRFLMVVGLFASINMAMSVSVDAVEVEDVQIADSAMVGGESLVLNGAGVRTKFFFDIYIGALYLPKRTENASSIIESKGNKRVLMHFFYDEVDKDKLIAGWEEGFKKNSGKTSMQALKTRLATFNGFFSDMKNGDEIVYDFLANGATHVRVNGKDVGRITGTDFQQALLAVWLGEDPADDDLKEGMLGE